MTTEPQTGALRPPRTRIEGFSLFDTDDQISTAPLAPLHLMSDDRGQFPLTSLNNWERRIVLTELARPNVRGWYRNPARAAVDSLGIAYRDDNTANWRSMHPDFVFFHEVGGKIVASILDPQHAHEFFVRHVLEFGRALEGQGCRGGHGAVLAEEVRRAYSGDASAADDGVERVDTRPLGDRGDQVVLHGIGQGVDHFVQDVCAVDEAQHAGLLRGPEVLPATAEGVHALREELVEVLDEIRVGTECVVDSRVVVIGFRSREDCANAGALDRDGHAVDEGVVGGLIRSEEELPLGAATGDHVGASRQDFTWERHADLSASAPESCLENQPGRGKGRGGLVPGLATAQGKQGEAEQAGPQARTAAWLIHSATATASAIGRGARAPSRARHAAAPRATARGHLAATRSYRGRRGATGAEHAT
jgi:hypothetical protein